MTLCISIKCSDGILLASDSRTVYGRGVPISRDTNKIHIIEKQGIIGGKIAIVGAGTVAFIDKFIRMFLNTNMVDIAKEIGKDELSLFDIVSKVAEPIASALYDEYVKKRGIVEGTCDLLIAGYEEEGRVDAFTLYSAGLAEPVDDFSAIGSGAAYAELFLRYLLPSERKIGNVIKPACYTIQLVGTIDPFVGGKLNLVSITSNKVEDISNQAMELPNDVAKEALKSTMEHLKNLLEKPR